MTDYVVEYSLMNFILKSQEPFWKRTFGPTPFEELALSASNIFEAASKGYEQLASNLAYDEYYRLWDARVRQTDVPTRSYEIMRDGQLLINRDTGKSLEKKLEERVIR